MFELEPMRTGKSEGVLAMLARAESFARWRARELRRLLEERAAMIEAEAGWTPRHLYVPAEAPGINDPVPPDRTGPDPIPYETRS